MDAKNDFSLRLTLPSDREIALTRAFAAPRALVFEAWTKPQHVARWYGCHATTMPTCEIDLRVGGVWRFVMRTSDGVDHTIQGVYREIVPPARLVFTEGYTTDGFASGDAVVTITFAEQDGRTTMTSRAVYASAEARDRHLGMGVEVGAVETMDRLAEFLRTMGA